MASSASSQSASRAILIPHGDPAGPSSQRQRPSTRFSKMSEGLPSSDNTSTSPSSSSQDSSWPGTPATALLHNNHNTNATTTPSASTHPYRQRKDKAPIYSNSQTPPAPPTTLSHTPRHPKRPILSSSTPSNLSPTMLASSSYTSINLNDHRSSYNYADADSPPRLITYTKHAQGFTWNDELFLPSYLLGSRYVRRRSGHHRFMDGEGEEDEDEWGSGGGMGSGMDEGYCPVTEIFVTDEEALRMMP